MTIEELLVRPGDPIQPAWERLHKWVEDLQVLTAGADARVHLSPRQIDVVFEPEQASFIGAFDVRVEGQDRFTVGDGLVNGIMPRIGGRKINGERSDGILSSESERPSVLMGGAGLLHVSWACVEAHIDLATGRLLPEPESEGDKAPLQIIHSQVIPDLRDGGVPDKNGVGVYPIAMFRWDKTDSFLIESHQIVMHDLQHRFVRSKSSTGGRHFFFV